MNCVKSLGSNFIFFIVFVFRVFCFYIDVVAFRGSFFPFYIHLHSSSDISPRVRLLYHTKSTLYVARCTFLGCISP